MLVYVAMITHSNPALRFLLAQINPIVGAIEFNAQKIVRIINAHAANHDVIVFPELALTGYPPEDLLLRPSFFEQTKTALDGIQRATQNLTVPCHIILGHPVQEESQCLNAASVLFQGKVLASYYKQHLPNYAVFDEKRYFVSGPQKPCILLIKGYRMGVCICEDIWHTGPVEQLIDAQADGFFCLNASPYEGDKQAKREALLQAHAKKGLIIGYVNQVGGQDELVFDGQSMAYDATGRLCARAPAFKEYLQTVEVNNKKVSGDIVPLLSPLQSDYEALVCGTRDYVEKNGFPGILLGLSGGIDSALTLTIAVDALGASRVHAVKMPSCYTASMSVEDADQQLKSLNVKDSTLSIDAAFTCLLEALSTKPALPEASPEACQLMEENLQARIRGLFLMGLSNQTGNLVLVTSNKSETAVGYSTLYGDMAGGFAPLKDVLKTHVYALARYRNTLSSVIPERVLTRAPSAELAPNQTDQDSLPPYPILDAIIQAYMQGKTTFDDVISKGYTLERIAEITARIQRNEYKRRQSAPGIKISSLAFGRDWRYPITSKYREDFSSKARSKE